ncbi:unnamed protein product, partial [Mesorhabditis belari]|uniref:G-protein coupled receptors family 1 profile domain-containing protein n=1 Tax=Mesorhabditis belari TaxID=2138241 RepID=A0AAF3J7D8_9BILA
MENDSSGSRISPSSSTISWYDIPLSGEDVLAGLSLIILGIFFMILYFVVARAMFRHDREVIGFRFLFSTAISDMLLLVNYSIWPGITILVKSEIITPAMRHWFQMYMDWVWFSMCYHYMIVAWSRFAAIRSPLSFRSQSRRASYLLCGACYFIALIQVLCTHFQPWYVTFYYEPSAYGMLSEDFNKYMTEGQSIMFLSFHILMVIIPFYFYVRAIILLLQHRQNSMNGQSGLDSSVESRLIIPCICNTFVFIVGQVVITIGTGEGRWATYMVLLLFSANSAVNPVLLLLFSPTIRRKVMEQLHGSHLSKLRKYTPAPLLRETPRSLAEMGGRREDSLQPSSESDIRGPASC